MPNITINTTALANYLKLRRSKCFRSRITNSPMSNCHHNHAPFRLRLVNVYRVSSRIFCYVILWPWPITSPDCSGINYSYISRWIIYLSTLYTLAMLAIITVISEYIIRAYRRVLVTADYTAVDWCEFNGVSGNTASHAVERQRRVTLYYSLDAPADHTHQQCLSVSHDLFITDYYKVALTIRRTIINA